MNYYRQRSRKEKVTLYYIDNELKYIVYDNNDCFNIDEMYDGHRTWGDYIVELSWYSKVRINEEEWNKDLRISY
jgi:hypothetical protein